MIFLDDENMRYGHKFGIIRTYIPINRIARWRIQEVGIAESESVELEIVLGDGSSVRRRFSAANKDRIDSLMANLESWEWRAFL